MKHMNFVGAFVVALVIDITTAHTGFAQPSHLRPTRTPRPAVTSLPTSTATPTPCLDNALCIRGFHWSPTECRCVPDPGSCAADSDCRLFSDTCNGCHCRALSNTDPDPACSGRGMRCRSDPCMNRTASCANGQCTAPCLQMAFCAMGFHWSPEQCACVPDRQRPPRGPHNPHAPGSGGSPHSPHQPHSPR